MGGKNSCEKKNLSDNTVDKVKDSSGNTVENTKVSSDTLKNGGYDDIFITRSNFTNDTINLNVTSDTNISDAKKYNKKYNLKRIDTISETSNIDFEQARQMMNLPNNLTTSESDIYYNLKGGRVNNLDTISETSNINSEQARQMRNLPNNLTTSESDIYYK